MLRVGESAIATRSHDTRETRSLKLGPLGGSRACLQRLIVHAIERLNNREELPKLHVVTVARREQVHLSAHITREMLARLLATLINDARCRDEVLLGKQHEERQAVVRHKAH